MHILHLEYSAFFRKLVKEMILESGHSPVESKYGSDVFKILAQTDVALIITGFELADMTGEELIQQNARFTLFGHSNRHYYVFRDIGSQRALERFAH